MSLIFKLGKYCKPYLRIVPKAMAQDAGLAVCDEIYFWFSCPQLKSLGRYKNRRSMKRAAVHTCILVNLFYLRTLLKRSVKIISIFSN